MDAENKGPPDQSGPLEFIDEVLSSWSKFTDGRILREPNLQERTFWFALYQLEELVENPVTEQLDPYEGILMQQLAQVREILRAGGILPDRFFASRPGEEPGAL